MKIGIISDTHGAIHEGAFKYLDGVDLILHAGDIGSEDIITELESIAPVTAVLGNTDTFPLTKRFEAKETVNLDSKKIFLTHRVMEGAYYVSSTMADIDRIKPDIVVFGHTHQQFMETIDGILFFNPGSAGQRRPGTRLAVGTLTLEKDYFEPRIDYIE